MSPEQLKQKLLNMVSILDMLPQNVDLLTETVDERTDGYILFMSGLEEAAAKLEYEPQMDTVGYPMKTICVGGVTLKQYINERKLEV